MIEDLPLMFPTLTYPHKSIMHQLYHTINCVHLKTVRDSIFSIFLETQNM